MLSTQHKSSNAGDQIPRRRVIDRLDGRAHWYVKHASVRRPDGRRPVRESARSPSRPLARPLPADIDHRDATGVGPEQLELCPVNAPELSWPACGERDRQGDGDGDGGDDDDDDDGTR